MKNKCIRILILNMCKRLNFFSCSTIIHTESVQKATIHSLSNGENECREFYYRIVNCLFLLRDICLVD